MSDFCYCDDTTYMLVDFNTRRITIIAVSTTLNYFTTFQLNVAKNYILES